ncbi:MAG: hypothetical protein N2049_03855, partial [Anaerolineales bacterium]|nr:hypothetical protein [Anaerolineales bacterium]
NPIDFYFSKNVSNPSRIHLFAQRADGKPLDPNSPNLVESLLSQLLAIEGNDASKLEYQNNNLFYLQVAIPQGIRDLGILGNILEMPVPIGLALPPELQQMLFIFEVGVAR